MIIATMWPYNGILLNKCEASNKALNEVLACMATIIGATSKARFETCRLYHMCQDDYAIILIERLQPVISLSHDPCLYTKYTDIYIYTHTV